MKVVKVFLVNFIIKNKFTIKTIHYLCRRKTSVFLLLMINNLVSKIILVNIVFRKRYNLIIRTIQQK